MTTTVNPEDILTMMDRWVTRKPEGTEWSEVAWPPPGVDPEITAMIENAVRTRALTIMPGMNLTVAATEIARRLQEIKDTHHATFSRIYCEAPGSIRVDVAECDPSLLRVPGVTRQGPQP